MNPRRRVDQWADRLRHQIRRPLSRTPYLWDATMLVRPSKRVTLARRDTAIVIDGFLRSGNTFSVAAFIVANPSDLHVARHLHGAPHLLRAARLRLPTVLLIRRPADAVASYLVRRPTLAPNDALTEYLDFYRTAWRARDAFVVGLFDDVVNDFGSVIAKVNNRFGTSFTPYPPDPESREAAFRLVEEMNRLECRGRLVETHVGRPSVQRQQQAAAVSERLRDPHSSRLLQAADDLYAQYVRLAGAATTA